MQSSQLMMQLGQMGLLASTPAQLMSQGLAPMMQLGQTPLAHQQALLTSQQGLLGPQGLMTQPLGVPAGNGTSLAGMGPLGYGALSAGHPQPPPSAQPRHAPQQVPPLCLLALPFLAQPRLRSRAPFGPRAGLGML